MVLCSICYQNALLLFHLLVSGDVHPNLGPTSCNPRPRTRYPFSICYQTVHRNQKALLCDVCEFWCHCKCSGVTNEMYTYYQQVCDFTWNCPRCIAESLPFNDCSFLTKESVDASFDNCFSFSELPQASSGLCIAHLNCRSFLSHKDEIVQLICTLHVDVLTLSETWLDDAVPDGEVMPAGFDYSLFRQDRHRHGGGIAIIISNNIPHRLRLDLSSGQTESLWGGTLSS